MNSKSKSWCYTINNPDWKTIEELTKLEPELVYNIYQLEVGENGTRHIQGYMYFQIRKEFKWLKKALPTAHLELRKGTHEEAKKYCSKKDTRVPETEPHEFGSDDTIPKKEGKDQT